MAPRIRERVLALNPWPASLSAFREKFGRRLPVPFVARDVDLMERADAGNAVLVVGPRQAGKSTSVWRLLAGRPPETVLVLDAEDGLVRRWCASGPAFVADLRTALRTVFVDEAQHLEEAGLFVKGPSAGCPAGCQPRRRRPAQGPGVECTWEPIDLGAAPGASAWRAEGRGLCRGSVSLAHPGRGVAGVPGSPARGARGGPPGDAHAGRLGGSARGSHDAQRVQDARDVIRR